MPKISIIVPIYNVERYLPACLDSVLNQTFTDFEIICINDGSTDGCGQILSDYATKDSRIKVITQKNQGVSVARNTGIQSATADYIAFVDSDDELAPTFLEKMYNTITQTNSDVVWCDFQQGEIKKDWPNNETEPQIYTDPFDRFVMECPNMQMSTVNKLYRREIVQKCPFVAGLKYGEDVVFLHQFMYQAKQVAHVPEQLYFYREREGSAIHTPLCQKMIDDAIIIVRSLITFFENKHMNKKTQVILHQKLAKRLFKFCVLEPKRKDKEHLEQWYAYTRPILKHLKEQGIYRPRFLTIKNRIKSWNFLKGK